MNISVRLIFLWTLALLATSCGRGRISVFSEYVTRESLASYFVGTPDPRLNNPSIGQKLYVKWDLNKDYLLYDDLHLLLKIRFRTREEDTLSVPICTVNGTYVYCLLNQDYFAKNGIWTYKIQLIGNGEVLDEWRHQIWVDLISFEESEACPTPAEEENAVPDEEYNF